ncbi:MAG: hypothetical protein ACYC8T_09030 [Myxococcaceae bacterium]
MLSLLPAEAPERLELLSVLIGPAAGDERADLLQRRSRLHRDAGRLDAARADLHDATQVASRPGSLLRELALSWREAKDQAGELAAWKMAVAREPSLASEAAARLLELATARLSAGDPKRAREGFEAAASLPLSPSDRCEAFFGLASAAKEVGDLEAAAAALLEASRHGPGARRVEALLERAELLEEGKDLAAAGEAFESVLALSPRNLPATSGLKRVLGALEEWAALAEVLAAEAAYAPKAQQAVLFAELGVLYLEKLSQKGPAEAALRRAAGLDPGAVEVRKRLVALLVEKGELVEATHLVDEAAGSLAPAEAAALLREGVRLARGAGEVELALRLARRAHVLEPARGAALEALAELLYLHGAVKEALPLQRELVSAASFDDDPDRAEAGLLRLADLAEQDGDPGLSKATLRTLVEARPLCTVAVERLAALLHDENPRESIELLFRHASGLSPSEPTTALLLGLSKRAREELADVELAGKLLDRASEIAADPLPIHRELVELYREAWRTQDLMGELLTVASLQVEAGDSASAIEAYEEEAALAEGCGRVDEALKTLEAITELCEDDGELGDAAHFTRRRAELLRDAKLDLPAAAAALERSFELHPELATAQLGAALARRREDLAGEVDWVERTIDQQTSSPDRAKSFLQLAKLHLGLAGAPFAGAAALKGRPMGPMPAPDQGEAALREALALQPLLTEAEELLTTLLEEQGRVVDIAAYHEEAALRTKDQAGRSRLLMKAAEIYKDRAGKPHEAAAALIAARAANPDDIELTGRAADMLQQIGRASEAAEFDAVVLEADPFRPAFARHAAHLESAGDWQALASLMLRRAERQEGVAAADSYLSAAGAFRRGGAAERARLCEDQAFEKAPQHDGAFKALHARYQNDARRLSAVLLERARAVPAEAPSLLRDRAARLSASGETLAAAESLDELLGVSPDDLQALGARADLAAEAGGASAAQPYDRRLLSVGGEGLSVPARLKAQLRLGHAALNSGAYRDATDSFEEVARLDPEGDKGREALSLLSEVHARTHNSAGLFGTSLALAKGARPDEAEALYRRAAALFDDPRQAIGALLPLSKLRPSDQGVVERAAAGLKGLGRHGELLELYERSAEAIGGIQAAGWLLEAAGLAADQLDDPERAQELRLRAGRMDPDNPIALRALADQHREAKDPEALAKVLKRLAGATADEDEAALSRLELAELRVASGDDGSARPLLESLVDRGAGGAGYPDALEALEALLTRAGDDAALGKVLAARAEMLSGDERAEQLLAAAQATQRARDYAGAAGLCRAALAARPSVEGLMLLSSLWRELGVPAKSADALVKAAQLSPPPAQGPILLDASEAWEASGDLASARELVEKVAKEHPSLLKPADAAARFERLGSVTLAAAYGFSPAMAAGQFDRALKLADGAADVEKAQEALWALSLKDGASLNAFRLATELREARDFEGLQRLGELCERGGAIEHAYTLFEEVALTGSAVEVRKAAVANLTRWGQAGRLLDALGSTDAGVQSPAELIGLVLEASPGFPPALRERAVELGAQTLPTRRAALLRELYELRQADGRLDGAAEALSQLVAVETDPRGRAALQVQLGELFLGPLARPEKAKEAFELALAADADSLIAVKGLLGLTSPDAEPERFVAMAERLNHLAGPVPVEPYREALVDAYEKLGRLADAHRILGELPESLERLARRAALATALGNSGEALQLRERLTEDKGELEEILQGYLEFDLVPFAVKLGTRLLEGGTLSPATRRLMAERLAPSPQGAALAVRLWPSLLRAETNDADGWTLFAEALRLLERSVEAEMIDGFGAALTASELTAPSVPLERLEAGGPEGLAEPPPGLLEVTAGSMPRLSHALSGALQALGAEGKAWLDPVGGLEAYRVKGGLVLGAGALSYFGPAELNYLCALAVALGGAGRLLAKPGPVEELEGAAAVAFGVHRASLAAARVLARLDERVRGGDPAVATPSEVLPTSAAFRAVALKALELVERP